MARQNDHRCGSTADFYASGRYYAYGVAVPTYGQTGVVVLETKKRLVFVDYKSVYRWVLRGLNRNHTEFEFFGHVGLLERSSTAWIS